MLGEQEREKFQPRRSSLTGAFSIRGIGIVCVIIWLVGGEEGGRRWDWSDATRREKRRMRKTGSRKREKLRRPVRRDKMSGRWGPWVRGRVSMPQCVHDHLCLSRFELYWHSLELD